MTINTPKQKQQNFYTELKALLKKYEAEMTIENFGMNWADADNKIVVNFNYDKSLFKANGTGIISQLVLKNWENGSN